MMQDPHPVDAPTSRRVRPFVVTGGRTASSGATLELETRLVAVDDVEADPERYRWESARILEIATQPTALIEVAARSEVPIGVARVLVDDLVAAGALRVHDGAAAPQQARHNIPLLEQVLHGLEIV